MALNRFWLMQDISTEFWLLYHTMSPIGKNEWVIRTLKEAAAVCGNGEKEKKGQMLWGRCSSSCLFFIAAATTRNASVCILSEEGKKARCCHREDILYVAKYVLYYY